jgi:hypothetical protein
MTVPPTLFMLPAILAAVREEALEPLREAGATSPERAVPLALEGRSGDVIRSLVEEGVVVEASPGLYYLDEARLAPPMEGRRLAIAIVLVAGVVVLAALVVLLLLD